MRDRTCIIDLNKKTYTKLKYKQYDNNVPIVFTIIEDSQPVDLTGYTVGAFFYREDGQIYEKNTSISESNITTTIDNNITRLSGTVKAELVFVYGETTVTSFTVYLDIEDSIDKEEALMADPQWDAINALLQGGGGGGGSTSTSASNITIADAGNYFTATNVEGALREIGLQIENIANSGGSGMIFENVEVGEKFTAVEELIECTGISLSSNALAFTSTNTQTLTATVLPSNCTEKVTWTASPSGIVSISNGVITPLKNGQCTITVTCGSQSATCNVTVSGIIKRYTVTNNLSNVTTNNNANTVNENTSYSAILTANENYVISTVTVTMGGIDVTNTVYVDGVITINAITGDVVITATAKSTIVGSAIRAKIETIDGQDYLAIDNYDYVRKSNGASILSATSYSNDSYQVYNAQPTFGTIWEKTAATPLLMKTGSINKSTGNDLVGLIGDTQEGDLYVYADNNKAIALRLPKDISAHGTIDNYMKTTYGGMKFALGTCNTKEIDPAKITSISIQENNNNSQYAQFGYSDLPTSNIYVGANSLSVNTFTNANLESAVAPSAAMSTSKLSIKFLPDTFADFTLDAVKEYLTKNPLIFWYV